MAEQALKWWRVRWRNAAIVVGAAFVALWLIVAVVYGVVWLFGPSLAAQRLAKVNPNLSVIPASLPTQAQASLSDASLDRYGFTFLLPKTATVDSREMHLMTMVKLSNDGGLMLWKSPLLNIPGSLSTEGNGKRIDKILGPELLQSKYKLIQAIMSATPDQVKWWRFRSSTNQREELLLTFKFSTLGLCAPDSDTTAPLYSIAFGQFRGFQCGSPNVAPYNAHIEVFDAADRHFAMDVMGLKGHGQVLTQEELNALVASIRPSPDR